MYLQEGTRDHFMRWLADEHPELVDGYERLYTAKYPPMGYRKEVKSLVASLKKKYALGGSQ
jgi:hypothetical protein